MALARNVGGQSLEQCAANARLIAAAPELYEALRECVSVFTRCDQETNFGEQAQCTDEEWDAALANARTALAKAEGL